MTHFSLTCRTRVYRTLFVQSAVLLAVAVSLVAAPAAQAQGRRMKLSEDLAKQLEQGDTTNSSVILGGGQAKALKIAAKLDLRVTKLLATGVVVDVPAGRLAALANHADVDALSSDQDLRSTMDVTNKAIGADLLHTAGALAANLGPITGKGIGVVVVDSGVTLLPQLANRVLLRKDYTGSKNVDDEFGHGTLMAGIALVLFVTAARMARAPS